MIIPNGYNLGRDWIAGNATSKEITNATSSIHQTGQTVGYWTQNGDSATNVSFTYQTELTYLSGLITNDSSLVNHNDQVGVNGNPPQDGLVAHFKVSIKEGNQPVGDNSWAVRHSAPTLVTVILSIIVSAIYIVF